MPGPHMLARILIGCLALAAFSHWASRPVDPARQAGGALVFRAHDVTTVTRPANTDPEHALFELVRTALAAEAGDVPPGWATAMPERPEAAAGWPEWMPQTVTRYRAIIEDAAALYGVPVPVLGTVILIESGGDPMAVSGSGARGLGQIMPGTARSSQARTGLPCADQPFDPVTSIHCAAEYLVQVRRYAGQPSWRDTMAGYNCGPGCLSRTLAGHQALPAEASRYWAWAAMVEEWPMPTSPTYSAWLRAGGRSLVRAAEARP